MLVRVTVTMGCPWANADVGWWTPCILASGQDLARFRRQVGSTSCVAHPLSNATAPMTDSKNHDDSGAAPGATETHDASGTSASALSPAAFPATVPELHAHWKLNPPSLPSTSRTSPQR